MANNNSPRSARSGAAGGGSGRPVFYALLIAIVVIGAGAILYQMRSKPGASSASDNERMTALRQRYATAGPPKPYVLGDSTAPVLIEEFADFECPSCGHFATLTEPDVRSRIIDAKLAWYKYYDFPLPMHKNSPSASLAAACADEQGKFWQMHDQLFTHQDQWGLGPAEEEVTDEPKPVFVGFAKAIGLDMTRWEQCYDAKKYQARVDGNAGEALRRNVESTPTFYVNGIVIRGAVPFDSLKKVVDSAAKAGPMSAADSAMSNIIKH